MAGLVPAIHACTATRPSLHLRLWPAVFRQGRGTASRVRGAECFDIVLRDGAHGTADFGIDGVVQVGERYPTDQSGA